MQIQNKGERDKIIHRRRSRKFWWWLFWIRKFCVIYNKILVIICEHQIFKLAIYKIKTHKIHIKITTKNLDMSLFFTIFFWFSRVILLVFMDHTSGTSMSMRCVGMLRWWWNFFNIKRGLFWVFVWAVMGCDGEVSIVKWTLLLWGA